MKKNGAVKNTDKGQRDLALCVFTLRQNARKSSYFTLLKTQTVN